MFSFTSSIVFAALVSLVSSQASSTSIGSAVNGVATHTVMVGASGALTFTPNNIVAPKGDVVEFVFMAKNHTATQSSFGAPCTSLVNATTGATGFDSGFVPVPAGSATFPSWAIVITDDTKAIWGYCRQNGHCGSGMAFGINTPATGNTIDKFIAAAEATAASTTSNTTTTPGTTPGSSGTTTTTSAGNTGSTNTPTDGSSGAASGASLVAEISMTKIGIALFGVIGGLTMLF